MVAISLCILISVGCKKLKGKDIKKKNLSSEEELASNNTAKKKQLKKGLCTI